MTNRTGYLLRWLLIALASGTLMFQSSCTTSLATGTAGLLTSITNSLLSNYINKAMGIPTYNFSLGT